MDSTTSCHGILFEKFVVEFWNENSLEVCSTFQVVIHAPSCWSSQYFLDVLDKLSTNQKVFKFDSWLLHQRHTFPIYNY